MKKILTDVDGVLVNWEDAFTSWMSKRNYSVVQPEVYNQYTRYGITKDCLLYTSPSPRDRG